MDIRVVIKNITHHANRMPKEDVTNKQDKCNTKTSLSTRSIHTFHKIPGCRRAPVLHLSNLFTRDSVLMHPTLRRNTLYHRVMDFNAESAFSTHILIVCRIFRYFAHRWTAVCQNVDMFS